MDPSSLSDVENNIQPCQFMAKLFVTYFKQIQGKQTRN